MARPSHLSGAQARGLDHVHHLFQLFQEVHIKTRVAVLAVALGRGESEGRTHIFRNHDEPKGMAGGDEEKRGTACYHLGHVTTMLDLLAQLVQADIKGVRHDLRAQGEINR